jgi:hypothetical protein
MLASFLVIRKGRDVSPQLDPDTEYYEPVTMTISVPEARSPTRDVLQFITRCVKPADQVRNYMTDKIEKCTRAPTRYLAFRLPYKSGIVETEEEVPVVQEVKPKPKPAPRKKKEDKDNDQPGEKDPAKGAVSAPEGVDGPAATPGATQETPATASAETSTNSQFGTTEAQASIDAPLPTSTEPAQPAQPAQPAEAPATDSTIAKRKKSVRISEIPEIANDGNIATSTAAVEPTAPTTTT